MANDYWTAIELFRSLPTEIEGIRAVAKAGCLGAARIAFLERVLLESAFNNQGDNSELAKEILRHKNLREDAQIDKIAELQSREARFVLMNHDDSMIEAGFWEHTRIPGIEITLERAGANIRKKGVHLIHCGIGSGKTSNVMLPLAKKNSEGRRALAIVPNEKRVYELAAELGWAHYHTYGNSPADIRKALETHDRLVICSASLRQIEVSADWCSYNYLYIDEITEILNAAEGDGDKSKAQFWVSLQRLFEIAQYADGIWAFTADAATGYTISVMEKTAREFSRQAYYYKTEENWGQGQSYGIGKSQEDVIWTAARWINEGQSAWGYCDFSDYNGELTKLGKIFQRLCPNKKIEWWDSDKIKNSPLGQPIRDLGLVEYVKQKRRDGELDAIIFSPVARSQYSVLFDESEIDLTFDFAFGLIRSSKISSPWDADQGLGRVRQTKKKIAWIAEQPGGIRAIKKDAGQREIEKHKIPVLNSGTSADRIYHHTLVRQKQHELAGRASREWLFREILKAKGARVADLKVEISDADLQNYLDIARDVAAEVAEIQEKRVENDSTKRLDLMNRCYKKLPEGWGQIARDEPNLGELQEVLSINREGAETLFRIFLMTNVEREAIDEGFRNAFYLTTGLLLDKILFEMLGSAEIQKQRDFFDWFVYGDESLWFEIDPNELENIKDDIVNDFELVRSTLNPPASSCGSLRSFLRIIGELIGLDLVISVDDEERTKWRNDLLEQYQTQHPGKLPKSVKSWSKRYEIIGELLREKLKTRGFCPNPVEVRMLDTMRGIVRATKKPVVARSVVEVYRHYLTPVETVETPTEIDEEQTEIDLRSSENPRNRNMVRDGTSEKSAS